MINNSKLCGIISIATKAGMVVAGHDACLEEMKKGKVNLIIVAEDASSRTKQTFKQESERLHISFHEVLSIEEISSAMGKVNKAVIGIKNIGFAKKMIDIINGGEQIG